MTMSTNRGTAIPMPTDTGAHLLTLAQWLSPAYPVGAFAYSHGLEAAIAHGQITDAETLEHWLGDVLDHGSGRCDAILLRAAYGAADAEALDLTDATARAFAASAERLRETVLQGAAFGETTRAVWGVDITDLTYPVAVGRACRLRAISVDLAAALYVQAFAGNLVSAAVRLVPLGQTDGQAVLSRLAPLCQQIAADTAETTLDDLQSTAFLSDIASMRHETLYTRLFRS